MGPFHSWTGGKTTDCRVGVERKWEGNGWSRFLTDFWQGLTKNGYHRAHHIHHAHYALMSAISTMPPHAHHAHLVHRLGLHLTTVSTVFSLLRNFRLPPSKIDSNLLKVATFPVSKSSLLSLSLRVKWMSFFSRRTPTAFDSHHSVVCFPLLGPSSPVSFSLCSRLAPVDTDLRLLAAGAWLCSLFSVYFTHFSTKSCLPPFSPLISLSNL